MAVSTLLRSLNFALALLCAVFVFYGVSTWLRQPQVPEAPKSSSLGAQGTVRPWRWFVMSPDDQQRVEMETLEEARLDAKLLGVVYAVDKATATLRISGGTEKVYKVGDVIQGGVQINAIEPYRVVVLQNGKREQISMTRADLPLVGNADRDSSASSALPPGFSLGQVFNAVPVSIDDQKSGLKLDALSTEIQQFAEFREGDVIVNVDNQAVQELLANPSLWMKYSTNAALPVTILRDGQESVIHVNAPALALRLLPAFGREK
jgi:type II secretory pathway component PulC